MSNIRAGSSALEFWYEETGICDHSLHVHLMDEVQFDAEVAIHVNECDDLIGCRNGVSSADSWPKLQADALTDYMLLWSFQCM